MAYVPSGNPLVGSIHGEAPDLDRKLRQGDGLNWPGDPRLELHVGILEPRRKGRMIGRRYEVWRHCEDGVDRMIGHWRLEEFDRILLDLCEMAANVRNHESVERAIDNHNAAVEKKLSAQFRDHYGEMFYHLTKLWHDTHEPRNVFRGIPGQKQATDAG